MVVEKHISRKRKRNCQIINCRHIDILKLEDVDMFVYDFHLTKGDTLYSRTIEIIKRLLGQETIAIWELGELGCISKRILTSRTLDTHANSDGAFIDNIE
jgi:hypothetical protein